jgi:hypothetical protein
MVDNGRVEALERDEQVLMNDLYLNGQALSENLEEQDLIESLYGGEQGAIVAKRTSLLKEIRQDLVSNALLQSPAAQRDMNIRFS